MELLFEQTKEYLAKAFDERIRKVYGFLSLKEGKEEIDGPYTYQVYKIMADNITELYSINVSMDKEDEEYSYIRVNLSYVPKGFDDDQYYQDEYVIFGANDEEDNDITDHSNINLVVNSVLNVLITYLKKDIFIKHLHKLHNPRS
ncbi:Hypothetical protein ORPV_19 [Orpheovirus IHUMI-LCC2]|uniref:Uncharacterized protein n=1 Tax=Orpheovirus IHUMI-LCC2 TaxID=2023057 RepID=A0A2I2L323_9VIRU|nr:Hypothetical protein ORPV_19 [Orpheovirus IHUMI-LCC2]SNW61923.1 Hypothetical protein ORPV_19 [Orpheovirus IHUMI-LCC2]